MEKQLQTESYQKFREGNKNDAIKENMEYAAMLSKQLGNVWVCTYYKHSVFSSLYCLVLHQVYVEVLEVNVKSAEMDHLLHHRTVQLAYLSTG